MSPIRLRVQDVRVASRMTQTELARRAGIRRATLASIEAGRTKGIDFVTLERLADALGVDASILIIHDHRERRR